MNIFRSFRLSFKLNFLPPVFLSSPGWHQSHCRAFLTASNNSFLVWWRWISYAQSFVHCYETQCEMRSNSLKSVNTKKAYGCIGARPRYALSQMQVQASRKDRTSTNFCSLVEASTPNSFTDKTEVKCFESDFYLLVQAGVQV